MMSSFGKIPGCGLGFIRSWIRFKLMRWKSSRRLLFAVYSALAVPPGAGAEPNARPNIVFILADDLGWADVAFHGGNAPTPHLDQLAREGLELTQHYVAPVCSPTRTGLMTGRCWSRFGVTNPQNERALPWGTVTTLVSWPGHGKPGKVQTPVHITDWLPTFAAVSGFSFDQDLKWDGTNLLPVLTAHTPMPDRPLYSVAPGWRSRTLRYGQWKLIVFGEGSRRKVELYDLQADPAEAHNLAASNSGPLARLQAMLDLAAARDRDAIAKD